MPTSNFVFELVQLLKKNRFINLNSRIFVCSIRIIPSSLLIMNSGLKLDFSYFQLLQKIGNIIVHARSEWSASRKAALSLYCAISQTIFGKVSSYWHIGGGIGAAFRSVTRTLHPAIDKTIPPQKLEFEINKISTTISRNIAKLIRITFVPTCQ
uniref:Uncharacterized protein n=1 Tax=Brugia timori TaxID=42155 RepID=A0A0R3QBX5_9BILA